MVLYGMKMGGSLFHDFLNLFFALFHKPFPDFITFLRHHIAQIENQ